MKVFITNSSKSYAKWIDDFEIVEDMKDCDIVIFTGGEDVTPSFYGEVKSHPFTCNSEHRDKIDLQLYAKAVKLNKNIVSICRGAQAITAFHGGRVIQHVNNHVRQDGHEIKIHETDEIFHITSTHHQMMYPYSIKNYEIIATSAPSLSDVYFKNNVNVYTMIEEPEIVYYPDINALCIQGHPEIMPKNEPVVKYLNKLIKEKFSK